MELIRNSFGQTEPQDVDGTAGLPYNEEGIKAVLRGGWAGSKVCFAMEVDSTNQWARRLAGEGAPHGTLCVAEYQTAGRGRLGRSWEAESEAAVMMTLLLRPRFAPRLASMLTIVMGLSAAKMAEDMGLCASIKWPNDIVVSGKKLCGILTEMDLAGGDGIRDVVIGVGINVNNTAFPPELSDKATSMRIEGNRKFDRTQVLARTLARFETFYSVFVKTMDLSGLKEDYEALLANKGETVRVLDPVSPYEGTALGINAMGELLVRTEDGILRSVNAGEVSVRGLYSYV